MSKCDCSSAPPVHKLPCRSKTNHYFYSHLLVASQPQLLCFKPPRSHINCISQASRKFSRVLASNRSGAFPRLNPTLSDAMSASEPPEASTATSQKSHQTLDFSNTGKSEIEVYCTTMKPELVLSSGIHCNPSINIVYIALSGRCRG